MQTLALTLPAAVLAAALAGCALPADRAAIAGAVQQAAEAGRALGAGSDPGSVASGGTGWVPCPLPKEPTVPARAECR